MKHFTFLTLIGAFILSTFSVKAQQTLHGTNDKSKVIGTKNGYINNVTSSFNLCGGTPSTSATSGNIYDPGGPTGQYSNGQACQFLINTGCTGTITLTFSQFYMESCCDYLSVYNGTNTSAPLLGTFNGSTMPPTLNATSGAMFLNWTTDGSVVYDGFAASWTSVVSGTVPPVANFSVSNTNPPLGVNVQFTDQTTNTPNQWLWQFGDGTTSTSKNPLKSYNTPGVKTITLTATNCATTSITTKTLLVQNSPSLTVMPNPITASVTCGGSVAVTASVSNTGGGDLQYTIPNLSATSVVNVLYLNSLSGPNENSIVTGILSGITNCSVTTHTLTSATNFQNALINKQVLLIPEVVSSGMLTTYSASINNFANNGGVVIINGNSSYIHNELGFFSISNYYTSSSGIMNVLDTTDAITKTLPLNINALNATYYYTFTNTTGITNLVTYSGYPVVFKKTVGLGKVIGLGYDYYQTDVNASKILTNAIKSAVSSLTWLTASPTTGTVTPGSNSIINLQFNSNNLTAGTYTTNLIINSNYPSVPSYSVPVYYTVTGSASSSVSATCKNFGSIMQYTNKTDSLVLYNTGCATMNVSFLFNSNAAYTFTPSTSFTIAPFGNKKIYLKFNPTTVGVINDTLRIVNNGGNQNICLSGTVTSAPQISVTPTSLSASVSCGGSTTTTLSVSNTGGSNLTYTATGSSANNNVKVLVISNLTYPNYVSNMLSALNSYSINYTVTQHTLTSASALQTALSGKDVVIFPQPYDGINTYLSGYYQTYSLTINNFVNSGGTAIMSGFYSTYMMNDLGLFNSTYNSNFGAGNTINVLDTNNVIMRGLPLGNITSYNYNYYHTFSNSGISNYATYSSSYSVISKRNIGSGRAIYLAFDYQSTSNLNFNRVMANCVRSSITPTPWLSGSPTSNTVTPSGTSIINYTLNSTGLVAGTYTSVISVNSNDPLTPTYTVPVSFNVSGTPSSSVSSSCKYFGNVVQYTSKTDSLTLYNTGCATMSVTSLSTSNSVYTYTPSTSFTISAFGNKKIYVKFTPTSVGVINDTLRITTNGGNQKVCLSGTVTSAPAINVSPSSYSTSLAACNSTEIFTVNIANNGGSPLTYSLNNVSNSGAQVKVLAIMNWVNTNSYNNFISSLNSYSVNYNVTQHTLTNASALQSAIAGKDVVVFLQPYNGSQYTSGYYQTYSTTINNFVNNGGTAITCGFYNNYMTSDLGLFSGTYAGSVNSGTANVIDANNDVMQGVPVGSFSLTAWSYYHTFTNSNLADYMKYGTYSMVSKRAIGSGRAIYIAYDYQTAGTGFSRIIANSVKSSVSSASWLSTNTTSATVTPSTSSTVTFTLSSGNLAAGNYTTNVIINSNDPLITTYTVPVSITVGNNPCANFNYTNSNNCTGIVTFSNTTVNAATSYSWNFGNGTSSTATNPTVTYGAAGNYSVTLTACTNGSCSSITNTLSILGVGGPITNTCAPISYSYSTNYGIINVSLNTINKSSGYSYTEGYQDFSCANQTTLTVGQTYTLTVTTSPYYNENCAVWIDYNNNGVFAPSEQIMNSYNKLSTHTLTFTPPGTAILNTPLRMRIIDEYYGYTINSACYNSNYGQAEDYTIKIQPNNAPPVAAFNSNANFCTGTVNFTDNSYNNPTSWIWNFGDGSASSLQNPSHTYTASGTYTVLLIASNSYGSNFTSQVVTVNPLIFNIGVDGVMTVGQPLTYTTNLSGGLSYNWDFGDGTLSGNQTTTHTYTAAGTYTVKLTIIYGGCVNTMSTTIVISTETGIEEHNQAFSISAYPNPFNTYSTIKINLEEALEMEIDIVNALGQKVKTIAEKHVYEKGVHEYSTDYLAKGIYFLKVNFKENTHTYKLISIE